MTSRLRTCPLLFLAGVLLLPTCGLSDDAPDLPETSFEFSTDPNRAVLLVSVITAQTNRAMTVYGDGRLVVTQYGAERELVREKAFQVTNSEVRELLQIAVDHGLVEFDEADVRARQIRGQTGQGLDGFLHAASTTVAITLSSYSRDHQPATSVDKTLRVRAAKQSSHRFPDIPEFRGIATLEDQLYGFWKRAGWELW